MIGQQPTDRGHIATILRDQASRADAQLDLARLAILLAAFESLSDEPLDRYFHHLTLLERDAADLARQCSNPPRLEERVAIINSLLFERYGYAGDEETYDDLQNADMMRVIDRRRGLPVALGILYLRIAQSCGWSAEGLAFPGHFLIRMEAEGRRAIIDPFNAGAVRTADELRELLKVLSGVDAELQPEHHAGVSNREVLLRLQNNRKLRLLRDHKRVEALRVIEGMLLFAPATPALWREAGLLYMHQENLGAAIQALQHYLSLEGDDGHRAEVRETLARLRTRLN